MRAAIYVRVSTTGQAEHGYSIDTQLPACRKKATELGATNIIEFIDDASGEYLDRPSLTRLREGISHKEFNMVIFFDPDRMARNLSHQLLISEEIDKSGANLHFVSEEFKKTAEGMLYFSLRGAISQYEKSKIYERTMRGKRGKLLKGKILGDSGIYGFDWDESTSNYKINKEESKVVRMVYHMLLHEKIGCLRIANRLNELGIKKDNGYKWHYTSVYRLLTNEKYAGVHHALKCYNPLSGIKTRKSIKRNADEWIDISVPAIIDRDTWAKVQVQLSENKSKSPRKTQDTYILKDILICDKCGKQMSVYWNGGEKQAKYYGCRSKRGIHGPKCGARLIKVDVLEEIVFNLVADLCSNKGKLLSYLQNHDNNDQGIKNADTLKTLKEKENKLISIREKYMRWFEQDVINEEEADKKMLDIKKQMDDISASIKKITSSVVPKKRTADEIIAIYSGSDFITKEQRKILLNSLLKSVFVLRLDQSYNVPEVAVKLEFL